MGWPPGAGDGRVMEGRCEGDGRVMEGRWEGDRRVELATRSDPNMFSCSENACTASMLVCVNLAAIGLLPVEPVPVLLFCMAGLVHC